jgi:hypothetical protein
VHLAHVGGPHNSTDITSWASTYRVIERDMDRLHRQNKNVLGHLESGWRGGTVNSIGNRRVLFNCFEFWVSEHSDFTRAAIIVNVVTAVELLMHAHYGLGSI